MMHTKGKLRWVIHDFSMASLAVDGDETDTILSVGPCSSCATRNDGWVWGSCRTPTEADAIRLEASWNALEGFDIAAIEAGVVKQLVEALERIESQAICVGIRHGADEADDWLHDIANQASNALALIAPSQELQEQG